MGRKRESIFIIRPLQGLCRCYVQLFSLQFQMVPHRWVFVVVRELGIILSCNKYLQSSGLFVFSHATKISRPQQTQTLAEGCWRQKLGMDPSHSTNVLAGLGDLKNLDWYSQVQGEALLPCKSFSLPPQDFTSQPKTPSLVSALILFA